MYSHKNLPLYIVGVVIGLALVVCGFWFYRVQEDRILREKYSDLEAIASLKVNTLVQWQAERMGDIRIVTESPILNDHLQKFLSDGTGAERVIVKNHLETLTRNYDFKNIMVCSLEGELLLSVDTPLAHLDPVTVDLIKAVAFNPRITNSGFYRCPTHHDVHFDFISPVFNTTEEIAGAIIFRVDPSITLFPLIQDWPTHSKSAETLIIRDEGDEILFLNELRHEKNTAMRLRIPKSDTNVPAVRAVSGHEGLWRGPDYRGVKVLADVKAVPGTNWYMIAKVDESEILRELRFMAFVAFSMVIVLILLLGATLIMLNNYRLRGVYKNLFQIQKELHAKEGEYRTTLYSIGDAVITTDTQGHIRQMNKVAAELTGYTEEEARGRTLSDVFHIINENTREKVESPFDKVIREGLVVGLANHTLLISKDGREIPIADSGAPIQDDGNIMGVVLVFRDQSEEREITNELIKSRHLLSETGELAKIGGWEFDAKSLEGTWTEEVARIHDMDPEEPTSVEIGTSFYIGDSKSKIEQAIQDAIKKKQPYDLELEILTRKGNHKWVRTIGQPVIEEGEVVRIRGSVQDITERKKFEIALRENEENYRSLFNSIRDAILVADRERRTIACNPAFYQMFGMKEEDIVGKSTSELYEDKIKAEEIGKAIKNRKETAEAFFHISKFKKKDGSIFIGETHTNFLRDEKGEVTGIIGVIRDVTKRIRNEEMIAEQNEELKMVNENLMVAKDKAEESDRLKTAFLQNLSHEIRTPMNAIVGFSSLLGSSFEDREKVEKFVDIIQKRSADLLGIISDILDTAKLDSGQLPLEKKDCRIREMCEEMRDSFAELKEKSGREGVDINMTMKLDPSLEVIRTDCGKLRQILNNLVSNALKYTLEGRVDIICSNSEDRIDIAVSDTGIGIPEDKKEEIFKRFIQLEEAREIMAGGTGLGLSIVQGLTELLGGEIHVESEHGKGSTFTVSIPLEKAESPGKEAGKAVSPKKYDFSGCKILVVEDDEFNADYIFEILGPTGAQILHTIHGEEAVKMSGDHKPDIILMDIRLPDINGYEATTRIKEMYPEQKIISQTAYASIEDRQKSLKSGCIDYISKPIDPDDLLKIVARHLAS